MKKYKDICGKAGTRFTFEDDIIHIKDHLNIPRYMVVDGKSLNYDNYHFAIVDLKDGRLIQGFRSDDAIMEDNVSID